MASHDTVFVEYVAGYLVCPSMRGREQRGHHDRCYANFFHHFLRSATIAALTASSGYAYRFLLSAKTMHRRRTQIINCLVEGNSIRSTERMTDTHRDTVMRLGVEVGTVCSIAV